MADQNSKAKKVSGSFLLGTLAGWLSFPLLCLLVSNIIWSDRARGPLPPELQVGVAYVSERHIKITMGVNLWELDALTGEAKHSTR